MIELADMFKEYADRFSAVQPFDDETAEHANPAELDTLMKEADPELLNLRNKYLLRSDQISKEFDAAGYNTQDWNDLMKQSGAVDRMGLDGGFPQVTMQPGN